MSAIFQKYIFNTLLKDLIVFWNFVTVVNIKLILAQTLPYEKVGSKNTNC